MKELSTYEGNHIISRKQKSRIIEFMGRIPTFMLFAFFLATIIIACLKPQSVEALDTLEYEVIGTHPEAAAETTSRAQMIHSLEVFNGKLYAGYGDYGENTGPVSLNPLDLTAKTFGGVEHTVPTEEIYQFRIINNKLYVPMIDPTCGFECPAGYAMSDPWSNQEEITGVHFFDMATLTGSDLWISGASSAGDDGATVWRSTDGGDNWSVVRTDLGSSTGRYYWLAVLDDNIYMQADGQPVEAFDGTTWTTGTYDVLAPEETKVVTFANQIITMKDDLSSFDGTTLSKITSYSGPVADMYISDSYLYVLREDHTLVRTTDLISWQSLGSVPETSTSLALEDGRIYLGTSDSKIYESTLAIPAPPTLSAAISHPQPGSVVSGMLNVAADIDSTNPITSVQFKSGNRLLGTATAAPYSINWDTNLALNTDFPLHVVVEDSFGNVVTSTEISFLIDNPRSTALKPNTPGIGVVERETSAPQATTASSMLAVLLSSRLTSDSPGTPIGNPVAGVTPRGSQGRRPTLTAIAAQTNTTTEAVQRSLAAVAIGSVVALTGAMFLLRRLKRP